MSLTDAYAHTAEVMVENMLHAEAKEGMDAFINKRPADWQKSSS
jgi:1,4-dihydroxy-2-naphthoyl-CoA synthase